MRHESAHNQEIVAGLTPLRVLFLVTLLGGWLRLFFVYTSNFPLNDGGMFFSIINDIIANNFAFPRFLSYNGLHIPFAYPPLAFYAAAAASTWFGIPILTLLKYIPALMSAATIPISYGILRRLLRSPAAALMATVIFSITPRSYEWLIMGGGLTRATGFVCALAAVLLFLKYLETTNKKSALLAGMLLGLTGMTHLEMALFATYSIILFALFDSRKRSAFLGVCTTFAVSAVICLPWLYAVTSAHGIEVYVSAFRSGFWSLQVLTYVLFFAFTQEAIMPVFAMLGLLGFWIAILKHEYKTPLWLAAILLLNHRSGATMATLPLAALATVALSPLMQMIPHQRKRAMLVSGVLVLSIISNIFWLSAFKQSSLQSLSLSDQAAMQWVKSHVDSKASFLVITPLEYSAWAQDKVSEWFPALTNHRSVITLQGLEWLQGNVFMNRYEKSREWKRCNGRDLHCFESMLKKDGIVFDHVYVSGLMSQSTSCCSLLMYSLLHDGAYQKIYDNGKASVWKRAAQKP